MFGKGGLGDGGARQGKGLGASTLTKSATETSSAPESLPYVTNLAVWHRANQGVYSDAGKTTPATDGQQAVVWADYSGNGNDLEVDDTDPPLFKANAINGLPALAFTNLDKLKWSNGEFDFNVCTVFIVVKNDNASGSVVIGNDGNTRFGSYIFIGSSALYFTLDDTSNATGGTTVDGTWYLIAGRTDGDAINVYKNGTSQGATTSGFNWRPNNIGHYADATGGNNFIGELAEVIIYNEALSTENRQLIESYIETKYAVTIP